MQACFFHQIMWPLFHPHGIVIKPNLKIHHIKKSDLKFHELTKKFKKKFKILIFHIKKLLYEYRLYIKFLIFHIKK